MIGTGFVFGTTDTHESFGLVEFGVGGVFGVIIDDERIKLVCDGDEDFVSLAVNNID